MAPDTMRFTLGASSGLTQYRRFKGVTLGEPGEPDLQTDDALGEPGELWVSQMNESIRAQGQTI